MASLENLAEIMCIFSEVVVVRSTTRAVISQKGGYRLGCWTGILLRQVAKLNQAKWPRERLKSSQLNNGGRAACEYSTPLSTNAVTSR